MNINLIDEKLADLESEDKAAARKRREYEILQQYQGNDRVILVEDLYAEQKAELATAKFFKSNIPKLDSILGGFKASQLITVSAPTGHGKSSFCRTLTANFLEQQINSLWFSYEDDLDEFVEKFPTTPICYMPRTINPYNLEWVETRIMESIAKYNCKVVFIDHLHYLLGMQKMAEAKSISLLVGQIMRELKRIAKEQEVTIFLVAHMKMGVFHASTIEDLPDIDSLRDSSFVAQESNTVLFLYRLSERDENGHMVYTKEAILKVAKNRRTGNLDYVKLIYADNRFAELSLDNYKEDDKQELAFS